MSKINLAGVIVVIIMLILLYIILKNKSFDNFIVFVDDVIIPKSCWEYLVTNGNDFFLFNSKMFIDGIKNPLKFTSKQLAIEYLIKNKCPVNIPYVDLVMRKKTNDPSVSLQRECNLIIAPNLFDKDICNTYASDTETLNKQHNDKLNINDSQETHTNTNNIYSNYDIETCMIEKVMKDDPELNDANFSTNFKQYFDRLNTHIDDKFTYITG